MPRLISLDFDGVLHQRSGRFHLNKPDREPVPGAITALKLYHQHFVVAVYSCRSEDDEGRRGMIKFLFDHGISWDILKWDDGRERVLGSALGSDLQPIRFPVSKPTAGVSIDDRSWPAWDGRFPTVPELLAFKPWWDRDA